jgi:hypothetical protein
LKPFFDILDHWQTLIAGVLAIIAALITVAALYDQSRRDRLRRSRAARALMPAALASISDYAFMSIQWLKDARKAALAAYSNATPVGPEISTREVNALRPPPEPETGAFDVLKECVEHSDAAPAQAIADLLYAIQVFRSRIWSLNDRMANPNHYDGARVLTGVEANEDIVDAVKLRALNDSLYPFARMGTNEAPGPIDLNAVATAFKLCALNEYKEPVIWNRLTAPYQSIAAIIPEIEVEEDDV